MQETKFRKKFSPHGFDVIIISCKKLWWIHTTDDRQKIKVLSGAWHKLPKVSYNGITPYVPFFLEKLE